MAMKRVGFVVGICLAAGLSAVLPQAQAPAPAAGQGQGERRGQAVAGEPRGGRAQGGQRGGGRRGGTTNWQYGEVAPLEVDARGWGWQTKSYVSAGAQRPFFNYAKEMLFQDKQVTSYTISSFNTEVYCEVAKHFDYIWFEMQHSTMSFDEVRRMLLACPGPHAAPMIRMPDAFESSIQKATDLGSIGIIMPTVDDALEARDAARFSRYPPFGRRSAGGGSYGQVWTQPVVGNYRSRFNDNMLVTVMIETLEAVASADEIAAVHGVDVVIVGNNDLSNFSGWSQTDPRYQDAVTKVHNAALKAGKYFGTAGQQYLTGHRLSAAIRFVQDGPARDGWTPPQGFGRGGGRSAIPGTSAAPPPLAEPVIGLPGTEQPGGRGGQRGGGAQ
jgi:2-keto-3-deoxy-L-rhamnonate aldolase RhmA